MSEHTPGPWRVGKPYGTWGIEITTADGGTMLAAVRNAKPVRRDDWDPVPEAEANAALIADAPRLARMAQAGEELVEALGAFSDAAKARDLYVAGEVSRAMALVYEKQHAYEEACREDG